MGANPGTTNSTTRVIGGQVLSRNDPGRESAVVAGFREAWRREKSAGCESGRLLEEHPAGLIGAEEISAAVILLLKNDSVEGNRFAGIGTRRAAFEKPG